MGIEEMLKKGDGVRRGPGMSRKDFLKLGGTGLAGAALLGTAGMRRLQRVAAVEAVVEAAAPTPSPSTSATPSAT